MARYQHDHAVLLINGYEITAYADGGTALSIERGTDAGAYTIGASGRGVFVGSCNQSGTLTLSLLQHSEDCKFLQDLYNQQRSNFKSFKPLSLDFKDTLNGDELTGQHGFFISDGTFSRGDSHNPTEFKIAFEKISKKLENGAGN
ncbi:phage protein [Campylobacter sp. 9BO]|uniref:phage protein n=1 Tax=Campylobacter sp. 9BO TaxID=3424759 RepID=UPI003D33485D